MKVDSITILRCFERKDDSMNCPSRTEEPEGTGFNQNPSSLAADLTTRQDLNGIANSRVLRRIASSEIQDVVECVPDDDAVGEKGERGGKGLEVVTVVA